MLLSVVIPVFNGERFLETILSCFRQQTVQDFELIFVDDGSTDHTRERLLAEVDTVPFPVTVETIAPLGVSAARNRGMELASGTYVSFVDVDDRIVPDYVEFLQKTAEGRPFDLLYFMSRRVPEHGPFTAAPARPDAKAVTRLAMLNRIADDPTRFGVYNLFIRRTFLEQGSFRFAAGYDYYEDYDLLYRMTARAGSVLVSENQLYFYVLQSGSAVATFRGERLSCVELLEAAVPELAKTVPEFVPVFRKWVIPRIYWSVLWQACLAFTPKETRRFARLSGMRKKLFPLLRYPGAKVRFSTLLFECAPDLFILAARLLGRRHSRIKKTDFQPFEEYLITWK